MNLRKFFVGRAIGMIILLCIVGLVAGFYALNNFIYKEKQVDNNFVEPYRVTLSGVQVCLPHKDTTGPQTLECSNGIKTDTGEYYVLDFSLMSQSLVEIQNGDKFTASGVITPIIQLSTDQWKRYNVEGIFSVTDGVKIQADAPAPTFTWRYEKADSMNLDGLPETDVFLSVKYENGKVEEKLIATSSGGCNDLPDAEKDSVPNSTNAQCYGAGLGYRFKITKGENSYLVLQKTFEEGLPDYTSPAYEYKVVSEFPL